MATLGPQKLELKRKREDEAPETLVRDIDHSDSPKAKIPKTHVAVWRLVKGDGTPPQPVENPVVAPQPVKPTFGVPAIKVLTPEEQKSNPNALISVARQEAGKAGKSDAPSVAAATAFPRRAVTSAALRKFHLSRSSTPVSLPGGEKRKRDLAVFEERRVRQKKPEDEIGQTSGLDEDAMDFEVITKEEAQPERKLKRPNLRPEEKEWRKEHRTLAREVQAETLESAAELAKFSELEKQVAADQQVKSETAWETTVPKQAAPETGNGGQPAAAQKTAKQEANISNNQHEPGSEAMDLDHLEAASDDDYVIDTYVREVVPVSDIPPHDPTAIGHLVIPEEDEELWELYADEVVDDEDANREFDTDDDDSNAEDYYGADYPEDEVEQDDEFDEPGSAYRYRHNASDEEEFDLDDAVEGEEEATPGWDDESKAWERAVRRDMMEFGKTER